MVKLSEDHVTAIGSLILNISLIGRIMVEMETGRALRWKVETVGQEGRGVVCGKLTPPTL
jgi:hypothetical protein